MSDLIDRQAAIDAIWDGINMDIYTREVKEILEALPSAEPDAAMCWGCNCPKMPDAEKRGEWKVWCHGQQDNGLYVFSYTCSECGFHGDNTNYCPNCGARMEE